MTRLLRSGRRPAGAALLLAAGAVTIASAQTGQVPAEEIARRQFESGLAFARGGNFTEALKDFQAVVELHPTSDVADDAWLQIGLYYLERAGDLARAAAAAETILTKYATRDGAAGAYVLSGRVSLAKSQSGADLAAALADFDRVSRLFPDAGAVAESLVYAGQALQRLGRTSDALTRYNRVWLDYSGDPWAPAAGVGMGMSIAASGNATGAIEAFQRVRNRWPDTRESVDALKRQTVLFRLAVRGATEPPFRQSAELPPPPGKLQSVRALAAGRDDALYFAAESGVGVLAGPRSEPPPQLTKVRGLALDARGRIVALGEGAMRPSGANLIPLLVPRPAKPPRPVEKIEAAVALPTGQWLVADGDEGVVQRFSATGEYVAPFATLEAVRLALSPQGDLAAIERASKSIIVFNLEGRSVGRIEARGARYTFRNPRDLAYDVFGHLYVLDETAVAIFNRRLELMLVFAPPERSPGGFREATALTLDSFGRLYVADGDAKRVRVYQ
jgi:TolA-binding protein